MRRKRTRPREQKGHVRVLGHSYPVLDQIHLRRQTYLLLEKLGNAGRSRFLAFDPQANLPRSITMLPYSRPAAQHLRVLTRATEGNTNVPRILNSGRCRGMLVLVLDWISGPTLAELISEASDNVRSRPSAYEAFRLYRGLAHGLSRLHVRRQVIHGDVKPANLIVASDPLRLVTIDFGSAWLSESTSRRDEGDGISAVYSAPELQTGGRVDFRADQFSATVVLYEMLTRQPPFDGLGGNAGRLPLQDSFNPQLLAASTISPDRSRMPCKVWRGIDHIIRTALSFDPAQRFATHRDWLTQVDRVFRDMQDEGDMSPVAELMTRIVLGLADAISRK